MSDKYPHQKLGAQREEPWGDGGKTSCVEGTGETQVHEGEGFAEIRGTHPRTLENPEIRPHNISTSLDEDPPVDVEAGARSSAE